jgi:hypothetical protein
MKLLVKSANRFVLRWSSLKICIFLQVKIDWIWMFEKFLTYRFLSLEVKYARKRISNKVKFLSKIGDRNYAVLNQIRKKLWAFFVDISCRRKLMFHIVSGRGAFFERKMCFSFNKSFKRSLTVESFAVLNFEQNTQLQNETSNDWKSKNRPIGQIMLRLLYTLYVRIGHLEPEICGDAVPQSEKYS